MCEYFEPPGEDAGAEPYTQCMLAKNDSRQVAWIPARYARLHRVLKLRDSDGVWDDGWKVIEVWTTKPKSHLNGLHKALKHCHTDSAI